MVLWDIVMTAAVPGENRGLSIEGDYRGLSIEGDYRDRGTL